MALSEFRSRGQLIKTMMVIKKLGFGAKPQSKQPFYVYFSAFISLLLLTGCGGNKGISKSNDPNILYQQGLALYYKERYNESLEKFKTIVNDYPFSTYSVDSELLIADSYFYKEEYEEAYSYYTNFITLHPTHPKAPYALFQKGMSAYNQMSTVDREQESTKRALLAFEELVTSYPKSTYAEKARKLILLCKERLAEREFYVGSFYFKKKNYKGAIKRFEDVIKKYPEFNVTDKALYYMGISYLKLDDKAMAKKTFSVLINNFPLSEYAKEAKKRLETL